MPRVPVVPTVSTGLRPLPTVQQPGVDPNPLGQVAGALRNASGDLFQLAMQEKRRADETRVTDASTTLSAFATAQLTDPERGVFTKQGKNAIGTAEATLTAFDREAARTIQSLSPDQRRMAQARIAQERETLASSANRHELQERRQYDLSTSQNAIGVAQQAAARDPHNMAALGQAEGEITAQYDRIGSLTGEDVGAKKAAQVSGLYATSIGQMLARDELPQAESLFKAAQSKLVGDDLSRVQAALERGTIKVKAQDAFATLRAEFHGDSAKMREAARERYSGDLEDHVFNQIDYQQGVDRAALAAQRAARNESERRGVESLNLAIENGQALNADQIEFAKRQGVYGRLQQRQRQIQNGTAPETDIAVWASIRTMTPQQLTALNPTDLRGSLNDADYERFLVLRQSAASPQSGAYTQLRNAEQQTFDAARSIGLIGTQTTRAGVAKLDESQQATYHAFETSVRDQLNAITQSTGKKPTPQDVASVIDNAKMSVLTTDGGWLGRSRTVLASEVAPDDSGDYRVPLAAIPAVYQSRYKVLITAAATAAGVTSPRITDDMVSRAAALHQRGGFIVPNMTAEQSRAFWQMVSR